ncbi:MAG: MATE family efflux transporter [Bullifex sp.]
MREERLGSENILKLVIAMALPAMLTMAFQALYNAFDSIFIARWSSFDFAAISITQPVISISLAVGTGMATGMGALVSRYLGSGEKNRASAAMHAALVLASVTSVFLMLLSFSGSSLFVSSFTDDPEGIATGSAYLRVIAPAFPFAFAAALFSFSFSSHARPALAMVIQSAGALLNIILDPVFIFAFRLGAVGAALATLIGHISSCLLGLVMYLKCDLTRPEKGCFS